MADQAAQTSADPTSTSISASATGKPAGRDKRVSPSAPRTPKEKAMDSIANFNDAYALLKKRQFIVDRMPM